MITPQYLYYVDNLSSSCLAPSQPHLKLSSKVNFSSVICAGKQLRHIRRIDLSRVRSGTCIANRELRDTVHLLLKFVLIDTEFFQCLRNIQLLIEFIDLRAETVDQGLSGSSL